MGFNFHGELLNSLKLHSTLSEMNFALRAIAVIGCVFVTISASPVAEVSGVIVKLGAREQLDKIA